MAPPAASFIHYLPEAPPEEKEVIKGQYGKLTDAYGCLGELRLKSASGVEEIEVSNELRLLELYSAQPVKLYPDDGRQVATDETRTLALQGSGFLLGSSDLELGVEGEDFCIDIEVLEAF
ncbi:hypothetical protein J1605_017418 [Eschrichtius robustus]|uniref:Uncharacterized protein n=1 Tax=Eschrichtius robustus TaxID=9764 RepID=A0AB34I1L8_ESCRO|nr:hypothetical protein J1605_017418 [Eschrichtius robustus]